MSPERLNELKRQRALVQEHLSWLDRQIAEEIGHGNAEGTQVIPLKTASSPVALSASPGVSTISKDGSPLLLPPEAQAIVTEYEKKSGNIHDNVKRGCILYFIAAFALIGLGMLALYLYSRLK